jgi:hypothetical protein
MLIEIDACMPSGWPDASGRLAGRCPATTVVARGVLAETIALLLSSGPGTSIETRRPMVNAHHNRTRKTRAWLSALLAASASACAADGSGRSADDRPADGVDSVTDEVRDSSAAEPDAAPPEPRYIDARSYFDAPEDVDAWFDMIAELESDFDDVCGDTFCEGEYSNYQSLRVRCSVEETAGTVAACVWVFGASNEDIDPVTGSVAVQGEVFTCAMPVASETDIRDLVAALLAPGVQAIRAPLPGTELSFYDGLIDCL